MISSIADIPPGIRVVVRVKDSCDPQTGRMTYRDYIGHVEGHCDQHLLLSRDPSANGRRSAEFVHISYNDIVIIKSIPERRTPLPSVSEL